MEWGTTWLLLQKCGRVWKDDLRKCYDGRLFYSVRDVRVGGEGWRQGCGWRDFVTKSMEVWKLGRVGEPMRS